MDFKVLVTTFGMIFLAELGDKTQLATLFLAAGHRSRLAVFVGSAGALVLTSLMAVLLGTVITRVIPANYVKIGAGAFFILMGLWMLFFSGGE